MKKIKKIISAMFVALLTIGTVPIHAESTNTVKITVKNTIAGKTYTAYPVLKNTSVVNNTTQYYINTTDDFYSVINGYNGFDLVQDTNDATRYYVSRNSNFTSQGFTSAIKTFLASTDTTNFEKVSGTASSDNEAVVLTFDDLKYYPHGKDEGLDYYFYVTTTSGSIVSTTTGTNSTVYDKNKEMTIEKTDDAKLVDYNAKTADVGQVIHYTVVADLPYTSIDDYKGDYVYKISDTMTNGLKFNDDLKAYVVGAEGVDTDNPYFDNTFEIWDADSNSLTENGFKAGTYSNVRMVGGNDLTSFATEIEYTTTEQGWTFDIHDLWQRGQITSATADTGSDGTSEDTTAIKITGFYRIVFTYSATVTNKEISGSGRTSFSYNIKNTAKLEHSTTPDNPDNTTSKESSTELYTTKIGVMKLDSESLNDNYEVLNSDGFLAGAEFVLQNSDGKYYSKDDDGNVTWVDSATNATKAITTGEFAQCSFDGIAVGSYKIIETKAPEGYNMMKEPFEVNLVVKEQVSSINKISDPSYNYSAGYSNYIKIANSKGILLPETGETGGMILTIIGCLAAIGAVIYVVKKKK